MSVEGPQSVTAESPTTIYKSILRDSARSHRLLGVHWELTYRCNERCTHCYLDVFRPNAKVPGELTTEECFKIIDQIAELGALNVTLSGGDLFTRRDWFEIASYVRQKRLLLRLFTNGLLIRPKVADQIASLHPYSVEISLYSVRPEVHDAITRVPRSWEMSVRAFKLLHERGVRARMKHLLMHENVHEYDEIQELAKELGVLFSYDMTITPKNSGALDPLKHSLTFEDLVWFMGKRTVPESWVTREVPQDRPVCGIGEVGLVIDPYGNVSPCIEVRQPAGNLRQQSLKEIWKGSEVWEFAKSLKLKNLPVCSTCEIRNFCVRCHGLALAGGGDITAPSLINCTEALARRQVLINQGTIKEQDYPVPAHLRDHNEAIDLMTQKKMILA